MIVVFDGKGTVAVEIVSVERQPAAYSKWWGTVVVVHLPPPPPPLRLLHSMILISVEVAQIAEAPIHWRHYH